MPPNGSLAVMALCRELIQRYSSTLRSALLFAPEEGDGEAGDRGGEWLVKNSMIFSNSDEGLSASPASKTTTSTAWELSLLQRHFHPHVAAYARDTARGALPRHGRNAPYMLKSYDVSKGGFNPPVPSRTPKVDKEEMAPTSENDDGEDVVVRREVAATCWDSVPTIRARRLRGVLRAYYRRHASVVEL